MESHNSSKRASGSAFVLVSGTLFKTVQSKISKTGNPYVVATICVHDGEHPQYWKTTAFSESARDELLRLAHGDAVSAQGKLSLSIWEPDNGGAPRINYNLTADHVLALRQAPRKREDRQQEARAEERRWPEPQRAANGMRTYGATSAERGLDDDVGF